jgi:multidrug efflux pump subunit AcrA (membrane-fusion protein)
LHTVSTDDAYVNSYVTFVAPRVSGQVARVLVDDNNRVKKGDLLVALDPEPFRVQVAIKQAAVDTAQANLVVAQATVRSQIGQTRGLRFKLEHAIEDVDNQIALIRARVATWEQTKATAVLAQTEFERSKRLLDTKVASKGGLRRGVFRASMRQLPWRKTLTLLLSQTHSFALTGAGASVSPKGREKGEPAQILLKSLCTPFPLPKQCFSISSLVWKLN